MNEMVAAGFAANSNGSGIAYVRLGMSPAAGVLRVPFTVKRYPALLNREVGYAALTEVTKVLRARGVQSVQFVLDDKDLAQDLLGHRDVPSALTLSYVRLRCALNQLRAFKIAASPQPESDLTARARSEAAMHVAA